MRGWQRKQPGLLPRHVNAMMSSTDGTEASILPVYTMCTDEATRCSLHYTKVEGGFCSTRTTLVFVP